MLTITIEESSPAAYGTDLVTIKVDGEPTEREKEYGHRLHRAIKTICTKHKAATKYDK